MAGAGEPGGGAPRLFDAVGIEIVVALDVAREAAFDQQLAADRRRVLDAVRRVERRIPAHRGRRLVVARVHRRTAHLVNAIVISGQFVARAHLPRQANQTAVLMLRIDSLGTQRSTFPGERCLARRNTLRRPAGNVGVGDRLVDCEQADRSEEPHGVFLERPALSDIGIVVASNPVDRLDAERRKPVGQVIAL